MDVEGPMFTGLYTDRCSAVITGQNEYRIYIQARNELITRIITD